MRASQATTVNVSLTIFDILLAIYAVDFGRRIFACLVAVIAVTCKAVGGIEARFEVRALFRCCSTAVNVAFIDIF